jgi:hypothetical protein
MSWRPTRPRKLPSRSTPQSRTRQARFTRSSAKAGWTFPSPSRSDRPESRRPLGRSAASCRACTTDALTTALSAGRGSSFSATRLRIRRRMREVTLVFGAPTPPLWVTRFVTRFRPRADENPAFAGLSKSAYRNRTGVTALQVSAYGHKPVERPNRLTAAETRASAVCGDPSESNRHLDFGDFCAEVPKSLHIGAYPRISLIGASCGTTTKITKALQVAARGFRRPA